MDGWQLQRSDDVSGTGRWGRRDFIAACGLALATAAFVLWQNTHVGAMWDASYVLEHATRIALGLRPYRDFPMVHPPLTFLLQAAIMKLTGHVFWHHSLYAAVAGAAATVLTWRMLLRSLNGRVQCAWEIALLLAVPLVPLGLYSIFPHPFYDPDCALAVLAGMYLLQRLDSATWKQALATGVVVALPLFVKQNIGIAYIGSVGAVLVVLAIVARRTTRVYLWALAGCVVGMVVGLLALECWVGLGNYFHWTIQYAASVRLPGGRSILRIYDPRKMFRDVDYSAANEVLFALWPPLLLLVGAVAVGRLRRGLKMETALPFVMLATLNGAFLSQQIWGSTYAMWPLLMLLMANPLLLVWDGARFARVPVVLAALLAILFGVEGTRYALSHDRLSYLDLSGVPPRSTQAALRGMATPGPWLPAFDQLVAYTNANIPQQDGILQLPGEDPFYYATGRVPQFPITFFDKTTDPLSSTQILDEVRRRNIRWLIVKRKTQLLEDTVPDSMNLREMLKAEFTPVAALDDYDVYLRK